MVSGKRATLKKQAFRGAEGGLGSLYAIFVGCQAKGERHPPSLLKKRKLS